jgi:carbonic anhydrase
MRDLLEKSLDTAVLEGGGWRDVGRGPGSGEGEFIDWLTIEDQERSLVRDVKRLRAHPLVPPDVVIHAYLYDVTSGRLREVEEAEAAGRASGGRAAEARGSGAAARAAP